MNKQQRKEAIEQAFLMWRIYWYGMLVLFVLAIIMGTISHCSPD